LLWFVALFLLLPARSWSIRSASVLGGANDLLLGIASRCEASDNERAGLNITRSRFGSFTVRTKLLVSDSSRFCALPLRAKRAALPGPLNALAKCRSVGAVSGPFGPRCPTFQLAWREPNLYRRPTSKDDAETV